MVLSPPWGYVPFWTGLGVESRRVLCHALHGALGGRSPVGISRASEGSVGKMWPQRGEGGGQSHTGLERAALSPPSPQWD